MFISGLKSSVSPVVQPKVRSTVPALSPTVSRLASGLKLNNGADSTAAVTATQQEARSAGYNPAIDASNVLVSATQAAPNPLNQLDEYLSQLQPPQETPTAWSGRVASAYTSS